MKTTRRLMLAFFPAAGITLAIRIYEQLFLIDADGLYKLDASVSAAAYALLAVSLAVYLLFAYRSAGGEGQSGEVEPVPTKPRGAGFLFLAGGVAMMFCSTLELIDSVTELADPFFGAASEDWLLCGAAAAGLAGGFLFICAGMRIFSSGKLPSWRLLWLVPMLWALLRMLGGYVFAPTLPSDSGRIYNTLTLAAATIFLFSMGKALSGIDGYRGRRMFTWSGLFCSQMLLLNTLPPIVAEFVDGTVSTDGWLSYRPADLALCALPALLVLTLAFRSDVPPAENPADADPLPEGS